MQIVFADSVYWIALLDQNDSLHTVAYKLSQQFEKVHVITSELVFIEVLNSFSRSGYMKLLACKMIESLMTDAMVTVVPSTRKLFIASLKRYKHAIDKGWSLVDCASFHIMADKKISQALTYDKHFEQAGFIASMRTESI